MARNSKIAFLSLGSNMGSREENLRRALTVLERESLRIDGVSSFYETEPVGFVDQPWFLNIVARARTTLPPLDLLRCCQAVEAQLGRSRSFEGAPRTIDIDILLYGDLIVEEADLVLPHPRLAERRFVLVPLAEIGPDAIHPSSGTPAAEMLAECTDRSTVRIYSGGGTPPCHPL